VDDAPYARDMLIGWLRDQPAAAGPWVLVACAPRMTHRISKWVSHSAREHWRDKWADKLFLQLLPLLRCKGHEVKSDVARGPVTQWVEALEVERGPCEVLDWRKPRSPQTSADEQQRGHAHWGWLSALATMAALQECA
jgi:hypothetical protein